MPVPLALVAWVIVGLAAGLLAARALPGHPPLRGLAAGAVGAVGAIAGGLLATAFGFGGIAAHDPRALVLAALASIVALLLLRGVTLAS